MEYIKPFDLGKSMCEACNKIIKTASAKKHIESSTHKTNVLKQNIIKSDLSEKTKKSIDRASNVISEIIKKHNLQPYDIETIYKILADKYKLNTIDNYLRLGLIHSTHYRFTDKQKNNMDVFIKNLQEIITKERLMNKSAVEHVKMDDVKFKTGDHDDILNFYKVLPLRANEFIKLKIIDNADKIENDGSNYIIIDDKKLILNNTKTTKYDEVALNNDVMAYIDTHLKRKINTGMPIFSKTLRTFERYLKETGLTSQKIRKVYANETHDIVNASRILNHTLGTHMTKYRDIKL